MPKPALTTHAPRVLTTTCNPINAGLSKVMVRTYDAPSLVRRLQQAIRQCFPTVSKPTAELIGGHWGSMLLRQLPTLRVVLCHLVSRRCSPLSILPLPFMPPISSLFPIFLISLPPDCHLFPNARIDASLRAGCSPQGSRCTRTLAIVELQEPLYYRVSRDATQPSRSTPRSS